MDSVLVDDGFALNETGLNVLFAGESIRKAPTTEQTSRRSLGNLKFFVSLVWLFFAICYLFVAAERNVTTRSPIPRKLVGALERSKRVFPSAPFLLQF